MRNTTINTIYCWQHYIDWHKGLCKFTGGWKSPAKKMHDRNKELVSKLKRLIILSEITKSLHRHYTVQEIRGNDYWRDGSSNVSSNRYWRCRRDVQRQSVPQSSSSDQKSLIADGWKTCASDDKRWCRSRAETLTSLVSRWLMEFLSEVRQSCLV